MGFRILPDGTVEADTLAEALQARDAILSGNAGSNGPGPAKTSAPRRAPVVTAGRTPRPSDHERIARRRARAERLLDAMQRQSTITSPEIAQLFEVELGKGLGSVLAGVKREIHGATRIPPSEVFDLTRSIDRAVGLVVKRGPRFKEAAAAFRESMQ